ncbi:MAG: hypothetical protein Q8P32_03775 [Candidatus Komeilibacteria bacterium]|nr:hypothetical protein [Candidatus Komeilibacteria bacterium]
MTADQLQTTDEEILVMDETGQFKVLKGGQLQSLNDFSGQSLPTSATAGVEDNEEANLKPILPIDTGYEEKMLQPPPPALYKQTSSFYFHPADEEEAAKHQGTHAGADGRKKYSLDKIAVKTAENYQLTANQEIFTKLRSAIFSFLRDRRSAVDTKDLLVRTAKDGGLDLKAELADNLLEFLREIKVKIEAQAGVVVDEKEEVNLNPAPVKFSEPVAEPAKTVKPETPVTPVRPIPPVIKPQPLETISALPNRPMTAPLRVAQIRTPLPDLPTMKARTPMPASGPGMPSMARFQRPLKEGAPRLSDVKKDYKLVGPMEELSLLTLETFRRLGETPAERAQKIGAKINLLAKESLAKKALGLNAWRQSPLYKLYVTLGQASMEHGLDLAAVINEYSGQGNEILTLDEFNAITDINKQLRF